MSIMTKPAPVSPGGPVRRPEPSWLKKNEKRWLPVVTVIGIFTVWEIAGNMNLWDPLFFSHPSVIWDGFLSLTTGPLLSDLRVTGLEFLLGMMIALGIGVPLGILLGTSKRLYWAFDPVVTALYSTPILVLTPLMVIWFGLGIGSKIANVAILAVFPVLINMMEGVRNTDSSLMRAARSFGANGWAIQKDVIFPSVVPFFVTGLRLAIGKGMIAVVVGEYIAATEGIGYRIRADAEVFNTPRYLAGVLIMVVVSVVIMALIKVLERKLAPWRTPVLGE
jgi:taurine transport system permease protein